MNSVSLFPLDCSGRSSASRQRHGRPFVWRRLLMLRVLLVVLCMNASVMWGLHSAMHVEHESAVASHAEQAAGQAGEGDQESLAHGECSLCHFFAHQLTPAWHQPGSRHPAGVILAVRPDAPVPPTLGRSWLHFPRDPPQAT